VAAAEADPLLEVITARAACGQTGATWQLATLAAAERRHDRERALAVMLDRYLQCADTGLPVHTWPVSSRPAGARRRYGAGIPQAHFGCDVARGEVQCQPARAADTAENITARQPACSLHTSGDYGTDIAFVPAARNALARRPEQVNA
jgi:hypothetical protein